MKKMLVLAAAAAATLLSSGAQAAVSYSLSPIGSAKEGTTVTFDKDLPAGFSLKGGMVQSANNQFGANPTGSSNYLTTNIASGAGSASLFADTGYKSISFDWGSIDTYNVFGLLDKAGNAFYTMTGAQLGSLANGTSGTRISLTSDGQAIHGLRLYSGSPAFEVDNVTLSGAVPEPATWAMMILGFGAVGFAMRRRSSTSGSAVAA